jgi:hypothetical protein
MTDAARKLTDAEVRDITARLAARPVPPDHPPRASVVDIATRRPPLGLAPIIDDEPPERDIVKGGKDFRSTLWDGLSEEDLACAHSLRGAIQQFDALAGMITDLHNQNVAEVNDLQDRLKTKFADIEAAHRSEVAELKLTVTELRCEIREMKAIQESARIASRGESGPTGPRGIPGPPGPAGARGERGDPAPRAAGFILNVEDFSAVLASSDGSGGPVLRLRPMFEAFAAQIAEDE